MVQPNPCQMERKKNGQDN